LRGEVKRERKWRRGRVDLDFEPRSLGVQSWVQGGGGVGSPEREIRLRPFPVTPNGKRCLEIEAVLRLGFRGIPHLCITVHGHGPDFGCCKSLVTSVVSVLTPILVHFFIGVRGVRTIRLLINVHTIFILTTVHSTL
jgi:hypothetical protein